MRMRLLNHIEYCIQKLCTLGREMIVRHHESCLRNMAYLQDLVAV